MVLKLCTAGEGSPRISGSLIFPSMMLMLSYVMGTTVYASILS
eukprot:CAMPEP_0181343862 /NCGR_PEP_ID=MMETSP1101-20121128/31839_1 /TAXON_ID=46948 /ORGANISM="Rhodomonas abbreviata, Strain Caron Lab Isolate" /LENGTH=42 /DNA_ID= /DNA_START= /DNA_END= /DNA_ORIENTATION=